MKKTFIGVAGFSGKKFDESIAENMIQKDFLDIAKRYKDSEIWIVSGLTNIGIPKLAYQAALRHGFKTMGIACKLAKEYECFPCDSVMIVGNNWGDESGRFLDKIEELFCYGGGDQTKNEAHKAKQLGVEVYSRHLKEIPK